MRRARRGFIVVVCTTMLLAVACGSSGDDGKDTGAGSPANAAKPTKVKVGLSPFISNAPLAIAEEEGYFTDEGLDVELLPSTSSTTFLPSLLKGDVDVLAGSLSAGIVNAIAAGSHVRVVADKGRVMKGTCSYEGMLVGTRVAKEITSVADLRGRTISYSRDQVLSAYLFHELLRTGGLSADDVKVNDLPAPAQLDGLAKGSIDAVLTSEPLLTQAKQAGAGQLLLTADDVLPVWQFGLLYYGPSILDHDRDVGRRFMVAYLEGVRQYGKGKTARNVELIQRFTKLDPGLIRAMCLPPVQRDGEADIASLLPAERYGVDQKVIDRVVPRSELWDGTFVAAADKELGPS